MARHGYIAIALIALWVAAAGTSHIPLNGHEVYVAETAREMQERGDWLIPYFNGDLRLNKPPLNYWLTGAIAWLSGQQLIQDWHARTVSALAATGLVLITLVLGRRLYSDGRVGVIGSLLLISSMGYFTFSHDARPDMLYAFCVFGGLAALAEAWQRQQRRQSSALASYTMWLAFALATLTKGPHVPAILLIVSAGFFRWQQRLSWRAIADLLRPLMGMLLLLAIAGPWWWLLRQHIGAERLSHSQVGGALLTVNWRQILNPYHLLRILQLSLPWSLLLPVTLVWAWKRHLFSNESLWLATLVIVTAIILGFGSQRRWFYMLPLLPVLCLLLADVLTQWLEDNTPPRRWLIYSHTGLWLFITIGSGFLFFRPGCCDNGNLFKLIAASSIAMGCLGVLLMFRWRSQVYTAEFIGSPLVLAAMLVLLSDSPALWSQDRFYVLTVVQAVMPQISADSPVVALEENPMAYIFYLRRSISRVDNLDKLDEFLRRANQPVLAIVDRGRVKELPTTWAPQLLTAMPDNAEEPKALLLLHPPTSNNNADDLKKPDQEPASSPLSLSERLGVRKG